MGSSSRSLELRVLYCKDLKAFNFFQKLSVYALVSLVSDDPSMKKKLEQKQQKQRTPTDTQGDRNPEWSHEMRFDLGLRGDGAGTGTGEGDYDGGDDDKLFLHFDMRSELAIFGDKSVGEVRVLLKDLINKEEGGSSDGIIRFVSYEVRTSDGKPNGVLSFSYKVLKECNGSCSSNTFELGSSSSSSPKEEEKNNVHIDGYPILKVNHINNHHHHHHHHDHVHYPSQLPDGYWQIPSGSCQSQELYYSSAAVDADAPHRLHYPSLEIPYPAAEAEEGYIINYPQSHDQFHYLPPPPPPPPVLLPRPLLSRPPFPPPPPPPFPPPPPHMAQGAVVYHPRSPWVYEHSYPN